MMMKIICSPLKKNVVPRTEEHFFLADNQEEIGFW
jgi:hypothetical protein